MSNQQGFDSKKDASISQPLAPEEVSPQQKAQHKKELNNDKETSVLNPGDKVNESKSLEEKSKQVAVDAPRLVVAPHGQQPLEHGHDLYSRGQG